MSDQDTKAPEVCTGCGSTRTREELDAGGWIACCPERQMVPAAGSPMSDDELAAWLGLEGEAVNLVATLSPAKRALFEAMRDVELWDQGQGLPAPGVILTPSRDRRAAREVDQVRAREG